MKQLDLCGGFAMKSTDTSLSPLQRLSAARESYQTTPATAQTGDAAAMGEVGSLAQAYLDAAKNYFGTAGQAYRDLFGAVSDDLTGMLGTAADATVSELQQLKQVMTAVKNAVDDGTAATKGVDTTTMTQLQALIGADSRMVGYLEQYLNAAGQRRNRAPRRRSNRYHQGAPGVGAWPDDGGYHRAS